MNRRRCWGGGPRKWLKIGRTQVVEDKPQEGERGKGARIAGG